MIDPTMFRADGEPFPGKLYGIKSDRSRLQIVYDYVAAHDLSARQVRDLVAELPGGSNVVRMEDYRRG